MAEQKVKLPKPKVEGFVIYNPKNQMFSSGGSDPKWKRKPKIWKNLGHLKNHLHLALGPHYCRYKDNAVVVYSVYKDCEIYNIVTDEKIELDMYEFVLNKWKTEYSYKSGYELIYKG